MGTITDFLATSFSQIHMWVLTLMTSIAGFLHLPFSTEINSAIIICIFIAIAVTLLLIALKLKLLKNFLFFIILFGILGASGILNTIVEMF